MVGSALKAWARQKRGRPRRPRWEALWVALRGSHGWTGVEELQPHAFAREAVTRWQGRRDLAPQHQGDCSVPAPEFVQYIRPVGRVAKRLAGPSSVAVALGNRVPSSACALVAWAHAQTVENMFACSCVLRRLNTPTNAARGRRFWYPPPVKGSETRSQHPCRRVFGYPTGGLFSGAPVGGHVLGLVGLVVASPGGPHTGPPLGLARPSGPGTRGVGLRGLPPLAARAWRGGRRRSEVASAVRGNRSAVEECGPGACVGARSCM